MFKKYLVILLVLILALEVHGEWEWREIASLNQARSGFAASVADGEIYVFGGMGRNRREILASVEMFSPENERWVEVTSLPVQLFQHTAVAFEQNIYIIGGLMAGNRHNNRIYLYDTENDTFITVSQMQEPFRFGHSSVLIRDRVLIMGGISWDDENLSSGKWFYPDSLRWEDAPPLRTPAVNFGLTERNGIAYAVGGVYYEPLDRLEILQRDRWMPGRPMPVGRAGVGVAFLGDTLFAAGGRVLGREGVTVRVEKYIPRRDVWIRSTDLRENRTDFALVELNERLYAIGGQAGAPDDMHPLSNVEVYEDVQNDVVKWDTGEITPETLSIHPNPCNGPVIFNFPAVLAQLTIYDLAGRIIVEQQVPSFGGKWTWNSGVHPAGLYIYTYKQLLGNFESVSGKIAVIR